MNISELICEVLNQYSKAFNCGLSKTKLLKLTYLTEIMYKRRFNDRITNAEWIYYFYGPYLREYDEILKTTKDIGIKNIDSVDEKEAQIVFLRNTYHEKASSEIRFLISSVVRDYGKQDLRSLLDYVYFETEPMMNAEIRGEPLDFNWVLPEDYYKVKELKIVPTKKRQLSQEFREKLEALRE